MKFKPKNKLIADIGFMLYSNLSLGNCQSYDNTSENLREYFCIKWNELEKRIKKYYKKK